MNTLDMFTAVGFQLTWLREMEKKHGEKVFALIESLLNQGFSATWIATALESLHPLVLDIFHHVFSVPAAALADAVKMGAMADVALGADALADGIPAGTVPVSVPNSMLTGPVAVFLLQKLITMLPQLGLSGWQLYLATSALNMLLLQIKPTA